MHTEPAGSRATRPASVAYGPPRGAARALTPNGQGPFQNRHSTPKRTARGGRSAITSLNRAPEPIRKFVTVPVLSALNRSATNRIFPEPMFTASSRRTSRMLVAGVRLSEMAEAGIVVLPAVGNRTLMLRDQLYPLSSRYVEAAEKPHRVL